MNTAGSIFTIAIGAIVLGGGILGFNAFMGEKVQVYPAHVGMVLTKNGYQPDIIPPSKFRLPGCIFYCDRLVLLEVSDTGKKEEFTLFMPKDELNMDFDIRFTLAIREDPNSLISVFDRVPAKAYKDDAGWYIPSDKIYDTYGRPVIREIVRVVMSEYSINEIISNRARISQELNVAVSTALEDTPLRIRRLGLAKTDPPKIIMEAKAIAAEREVEIQKAEANKQIQLVNLQTALEVAKMNKVIRLERADAALKESIIFAKSMTPEFERYKNLEILFEMAQNDNTVFVPYGALDNLGLNQRIFNEQPQQQ